MGAPVSDGLPPGVCRRRPFRAGSETGAPQRGKKLRPQDWLTSSMTLFRRRWQGDRQGVHQVSEEVTHLRFVQRFKQSFGHQ